MSKKNRSRKTKEKNRLNPATLRQLAFLKELDYDGDFEDIALTIEKACAIIDSLVKKKESERVKITEPQIDYSKFC